MCDAGAPQLAWENREKGCWSPTFGPWTLGIKNDFVYELHVYT